MTATDDVWRQYGKRSFVITLPTETGVMEAEKYTLSLEFCVRMYCRLTLILVYMLIPQISGVNIGEYLIQKLSSVSQRFLIRLWGTCEPNVNIFNLCRFRSKNDVFIKASVL